MPKISDLSLADSVALADTDYVPVVVGGVTRRVLISELREEMQQGFNVLFFGAVADSDADGVGTDNTAAFQLAIDTAYGEGAGSVYVPDGKYSILGTIQNMPGVTLYGVSATGQYYHGYPMSSGATLIKPDGGTAGPIIVVNQTSALHHLAFKHLKSEAATTGVIQIGPSGTTENVIYCSLSDLFIIGLRTTVVDGSTTCYGIYFPNSQIGYGRYFNHFQNIWVTECDVAVHLGEQANANHFVNITTRECHVHFELNGGTSSYCIENSFVGLGAFSIDILTPESIVFKLRNGASRNTFLGWASESYGHAYDFDASSAANFFVGTPNEPTTSYIPDNNYDLTYSPPINVNGYSSVLLQTSTTGTRNIHGAGNRLTFFKRVAGVLPQINNAAGTLVASDADNKKIIQFPAGFTKASNISFDARLRVWAYCPANHGMYYADIEFTWLNTNQTSTTGWLSVKSAVRKKHVQPNDHITGLYFLTGVAAGTSFAIALVGGNQSAANFDTIYVSLEIDAITYSTNVIDMSAHAVFLFDTADVTANDVTDSISLLAVADTTV